MNRNYHINRNINKIFRRFDKDIPNIKISIRPKSKQDELVIMTVGEYNKRYLCGDKCKGTCI
jgi:hypothetical protein